ncbi:MAG: glycoside hydrolase family 97 N-terminal domain-containing protein [Bacteroidales bacterium]|nr:glycoside hydrolase family 97 N-terminal domain-containing protein [Bacteroidales bacterium]
MIRDLLLSIILVLFLFSCRNSNSNFEAILPSADSKTHLYFNLNDGEPYYLVYYDNDILIDWSMLGFIIDDTINFYEGLLVNNVESRSALQSKEDFFSGFNAQLETYNEITILLDKIDCIDFQLSIVLRVYNDAVAYKYIFNHVNGNRQVKEITELDLYNDLFKKVVVKNTVLTNSSLSTFSIDETDTLNIPSTFDSDKKYKIDYLHSITQDYPLMKLVRRNPGKNEYRLIVADNDEPAISVNSGFEIPWRIIYITNNLK